MTVEFVPNPAYAGKTPRPLKASCHDGSPFITFRCECGGEGHVHETQLAAAPVGVEVGVRCPACREPLVFAPGQLEAGFKQLRDDGWIE